MGSRSLTPLTPLSNSNGIATTVHIAVNSDQSVIAFSSTRRPYHKGPMIMANRPAPHERGPTKIFQKKYIVVD